MAERYHTKQNAASSIKEFVIRAKVMSRRWARFLISGEHTALREGTRAMDEILTASQVDDLLQLNRRTVYRLARQGSIPGIKLGSGWRFNRSEILQLASVHEKSAQSSPTAVTPIKEVSRIMAMRSYIAVKSDELPTDKI